MSSIHAVTYFILWENIVYVPTCTLGIYIWCFHDLLCYTGTRSELVGRLTENAIVYNTGLRKQFIP